MRSKLWGILSVLAIFWGAAVVSGFFVLSNYGNTPGADGKTVSDWPSETGLALDGDRPTLVLAAHPHCPCSRASLGELEEILARCPGQAAAHVLFYKPATFPSGWEKSALWDEAAVIGGVQVHCDEEGVEARRFGALTSGQAFLFSARGKLLFRGGITAARGHAGDNAGREAIISLLNAGTTERITSPVFGCPLFDSASTSDVQR